MGPPSCPLNGFPARPCLPRKPAGRDYDVPLTPDPVARAARPKRLALPSLPLNPPPETFSPGFDARRFPLRSALPDKCWSPLTCPTGGPMVSGKETTMGEEVERRAGEPAPLWEGRWEKGNTVRLRISRGTRVPPYSYPTNASAGGTRQACGFRGRCPEIQEKNAVVL